MAGPGEGPVPPPAVSAEGRPAGDRRRGLRRHDPGLRSRWRGLGQIGRDVRRSLRVDGGLARRGLVAPDGPHLQRPRTGDPPLADLQAHAAVVPGRGDDGSGPVPAAVAGRGDPVETAQDGAIGGELSELEGDLPTRRPRLHLAGDVDARAGDGDDVGRGGDESDGPTARGHRCDPRGRLARAVGHALDGGRADRFPASGSVGEGRVLDDDGFGGQRRTRAVQHRCADSRCERSRGNVLDHQWTSPLRTITPSQ